MDKFVKSRKKRTTVYINSAVWELAKNKAQQLGVPVSKLIEEFLRAVANVQITQNNNIIINANININNNTVAPVNDLVIKNTVFILEDIAHQIKQALKKAGGMYSTQERAMYLNNFLVYLLRRIEALLMIFGNKGRWFENLDFSSM